MVYFVHMTSAILTEIKNNTVALPKAWKGAKVLVRVSGNTATITKVTSSKTVFTKADVRALRRLGKKVSGATVRRALARK